MNSRPTVRHNNSTACELRSVVSDDFLVLIFTVYILASSRLNCTFNLVVYSDLISVSIKYCRSTDFCTLNNTSQLEGASDLDNFTKVIRQKIT